MVLLLAACTGGSTETGDSKDTTVSGDVVVEATLKESVFRVKWDTQFEADATVECGIDDAFDKSISGTSSADGLSHEVLLASLGEATTWTCRAQSVGSGSKAWTSESFDVDIPAAPTGMPGKTVTVSTDDSLDGFVLVDHTAEGAAYTGIIDREGRHTWWDEGDEHDIISQAWLTPDGQYFMWLGMNEAGQVHKVSLDGETDVTWTIDAAHHDFIPLPDGNVAVLRYDARDYDGVEVEGDDLAIYDTDGNLVRVLWSTFDSFEPDPETFPPDTDYFDWTHANSIWYEEEQDLFLVSLWSYDLVVAVDANDGEVLWRLGTTSPEYTFEGEGEAFADQHSPRLTDGGLLVFNNRDIVQASGDDLWSEVVEYEVDWDARTYRRAWSYDADRALPVYVMGNADELDDGHVFTAWGSGGRLVELDADHEVVWQVDADLGGPFGFSHHVDEVAGATR